MSHYALELPEALLHEAQEVAQAEVPAIEEEPAGPIEGPGWLDLDLVRPVG